MAQIASVMEAMDRMICSGLKFDFFAKTPGDD
jgi:hypothetical protein